MIGDSELTTKMLEGLKHDADQLESQVAELSFHVNNGTSYHEWWQLSYLERCRFIELINSKIAAQSGKEYF